MIFRNRTPSEFIGYGLYFYFSGLSLRKAADRLSDCFIKKKPCFYLELMDTKVQALENILKEKENLRVCYR